MLSGLVLGETQPSHRDGVEALTLQQITRTDQCFYHFSPNAITIDLLGHSIHFRTLSDFHSTNSLRNIKDFLFSSLFIRYKAYKAEKGIIC
jgi:hypothetical protein